MKHGLVLDRVVLLGRTFEEYLAYFDLSPEFLRGKRVLDAAAGVSSFCAEARSHGFNVTASDPIYNWAPEAIRSRCEPDLDHVVSALRDLPTYRWLFYRDPEHMRHFRERAYQRFLQEYRGDGAPPYVAACLPRLPFADACFDVALVSYLLFVYEEQFSYGFHRDSIADLMRVTSGELRIYPIVTFEGERSQALEHLLDDPQVGHLQFEIVPTHFEFLVGSNSFLRVQHRQ